MLTILKKFPYPSKRKKRRKNIAVPVPTTQGISIVSYTAEDEYYGVEDENIKKLIYEMGYRPRIKIIKLPDFRIYYFGGQEAFVSCPRQEGGNDEGEKISSLLKEEKGYKVSSSGDTVIAHAGNTNLEISEYNDVVNVETTTWDGKMKRMDGLIVYKITRVEGYRRIVDIDYDKNNAVITKLYVPKDEVTKALRTIDINAIHSFKSNLIKIRLKTCIPIAMAELILIKDKKGYYKDCDANASQSARSATDSPLRANTYSLNKNISISYGSNSFRYEINMASIVPEFDEEKDYKRGCGVGIHAFLQPKHAFDYFSIKMDNVIDLHGFLEAEHEFEKEKWE